MALTWEDFEASTDFRKCGTGDRTEKTMEGKSETGCAERKNDDIEAEQPERMRLNISKTILRDGTLKCTTKNKKNRKIPLCPIVIGLYADNCQIREGGRADRIFTDTYDAYIGRLAAVCRKLDIPHCTCHSFRHTFISNLMRRGVPLPVIEKVSGDTQKTIFDRYSHMFDDDEELVLRALEDM